MKTIELTHTELKVLNSISRLQAALGDKTRINIQAIARASQCHSNTVWIVVNALEAKGIIERDTKPRLGTLYRILNV